MGLSQGNRRKVTGIIPGEIVKGVATGEIEPLTEKELKQFEKIREKLILETFGLTKKEYKIFMEDFNKMQVGQNTTSRNETDILRDKRNVALGQIGSNKKAKKEVVKQGIKVVGVTGAFLFSGAAEKISAITASISSLFPYLGIIFAAVGFLIAYKMYKKASKGNISDAEEKLRDYEDFLKGFVENIKKLVNSLENDKEMIMNKKRELSTKDFNKFLNSYIKTKVKELGLSNEVPIEEAIKMQQLENSKSMKENNEILNIGKVQFGGA